MNEMSITAAQVVAEARRYADRFSGFVPSWLIRRRPYICPFDMILNHVPSGASVFDIGCGNGFLLHAAASLRAAARAAGVDYNAHAIAAAAKALPQDFSPGACTLVAAAAPGSWPDGTYDAVTMVDVLHHLTETMQRDFLTEAAKRLRPGGVIIVKDMAKKPLLYNVMNRLHDLVLARQWIRYTDADTVASALADAGLTPVAHRQKRMYWYAHWMVVMQRP